MTYEELGNFTWGELENLTWGDLELSPTELLQKIVEEYDAENIPSSVLIKLQKICDSLSQSCKEYKIEVPAQINNISTKTKLTKRELLSIVSEIAGIVGLILTLRSQSEPTNQPTTIINNYYGDVYIIEEYPKEVDNIIEELKQTGNIQIDVSDDFIDSQPEENLKKKI